MSLEQTDFESLCEDDLRELIEVMVPEGLRLDYKLTQYGNSDKDKRELLKDISAFANSHGGHIILGIREVEGVANEIVGLEIDTDSEILRIENILRHGLEPVISGIRIISIHLENEKKAIVIRIPRSWNSPHRVITQGVNRFHIRHSAGVHEPSVGELRTMFSQSSDALDKARKFRDKRVTKICSMEGLRPLEGGGRLFIHIVPIASISGMVNLDVEEIHNKHNNFWPLGSTGKTSKFNYDGFINERSGDKNYGYTQIFRNGIIEATKSNIVQKRDEKRIIPVANFEKHIFENLHKYIDGLKEINIPTPIIILLTLEGVFGSRYEVESNPWGDEGPLPEDLMQLPEGLIDNYGKKQDYHLAVKPAFDALWNAVGYSGSQFFNTEGEWVGRFNKRT